MKKAWPKVAGIVFLAVVLMVLVGLVSFRTVAPTGMLIAPLAGSVSTALVIALGTTAGLVTAAVGGIFLLFLQNADWVLVANFVILALFIGWLIGWRIPLNRRLTHQQLIWLGIVSGISELVLTVLLTALVGWQTGGDWLAFVRLNILPTILTALLDAVFVGPLALAFRWLARQILPVVEDGQDTDPHSPVEINLSKKDKQNKK